MTLSDYMASFPSTLPLRITTPSKVDARTLALRFTDWRMADWSSLTQAWSWDGTNGAPGGDVLIVLTGTLGRSITYAAIRVGDFLTVQEISSGIAGWFAAWGVTTKVMAS